MREALRSWHYLKINFNNKQKKQRLRTEDILMQQKLLSVTKRTRSTPYSRRVEAAGVKAYTVYNHMLLPTLFDTPEADYYHLCEHVQVWDVSCERQVEICGPDAARLVQLMTPRDLSKTALLQGKYAPLCDAQGNILNDPIMIKLADDRWWISIADSDIKLWALGLAQGYGLDVNVFEPDVFPLAVQGPKAEELICRIFGEEAKSIKFFRGKMLAYRGELIYVARSGWSKQGGFEIYLHKAELGELLWDDLFAAGQDLNVGPGYPNGVERIEAGLLSFGSDITETNNPFECGLDSYLNLNADIESLSLPALRKISGSITQRLVGIVFDQSVDFSGNANTIGGFDVYHDDRHIGEVRSQTWSWRYKKHLAMAMIETAYLATNHQVLVGACVGTIHELPFMAEVLAN
jgi:dimethylsulfoniopropionate demethylase